MPATRDCVEAVIRQQLTRIVRVTRLLGGTPATATLNEAVDVILAAVDDHTMAEVGLLTPAERRHVLYEATS